MNNLSSSTWIIFLGSLFLEPAFNAFLGALIAGFIGFLTARHIQDRQFRNEERIEKETLKALLETLKEDIVDYYRRLKELKIALSEKTLFQEYFNLSNKDAIWSLLVKAEIFVQYRDIFGKVNRMYRRLSILNREIPVIQEILIYNKKKEYQESPEATRQRLSDGCIKIIDSIISEDIGEDERLRNELKNIIENLQDVKNDKYTVIKRLIAKPRSSLLFNTRNKGKIMHGYKKIVKIIEKIKNPWSFLNRPLIVAILSLIVLKSCYDNYKMVDILNKTVLYTPYPHIYGYMGILEEADARVIEHSAPIEINANEEKKLYLGVRNYNLMSLKDVSLTLLFPDGIEVKHYKEGAWLEYKTNKQYTFQFRGSIHNGMGENAEALIVKFAKRGLYQIEYYISGEDIKGSMRSFLVKVK